MVYERGDLPAELGRCASVAGQDQPLPARCRFPPPALDRLLDTLESLLWSLPLGIHSRHDDASCPTVPSASHFPTGKDQADNERRRSEDHRKPLTCWWIW